MQLGHGPTELRFRSLEFDLELRGDPALAGCTVWMPTQRSSVALRSSGDLAGTSCPPGALLSSSRWPCSPSASGGTSDSLAMSSGTGDG